MPDITVWTKQNRKVLEQLEAYGRFIADERYIRIELEDTADIMLYIYQWLARQLSDDFEKPSDAVYPVWVSLSHEATMMPEEGYVVLKLSVDESKIEYLDTAKWTKITNYSYIPSDDQDERAHNKLLEELGISNAQAVMSRFYPEVREKIIKSWDRLFDDSVSLGSNTKYGVIWEVRKDWIKRIIQ